MLRYINLQVDNDVLFFAFRYSLGRSSYAPYTVMAAIKENINKISTSEIEKYLKEIYECESYGMDLVKEHWLKFAKYLEQEIRDRSV